MAALIALGMVSLGHGLYLPAKAVLAQHLVQRAWQRGEALPEPLARSLRPWPWADTHPVARLTSDASDDELFVLSGGSGRTLAFGPGHLESSVLPGERGNSVIIGHRDTHFRFLADLEAGDHLVIDRRDGRRMVFRVASLDVVDATRATIRLDSDQPRLTLVTCYPFDAVRPGGPLRYVVSALPVEPALQAARSPSF
jgi:sortase A